MNSKPVSAESTPTQSPRQKSEIRGRIRRKQTSGCFSGRPGSERSNPESRKPRILIRILEKTSLVGIVFIKFFSYVKAPQRNPEPEQAFEF